MEIVISKKILDFIKNKDPKYENIDKDYLNTKKYIGGKKYKASVHLLIDDDLKKDIEKLTNEYRKEYRKNYVSGERKEKLKEYMKNYKKNKYIDMDPEEKQRLIDHYEQKINDLKNNQIILDKKTLDRVNKNIHETITKKLQDLSPTN